MVREDLWTAQDGPEAGPREAAACRWSDSDEVMGPVIAGAHARGVADAFEALGMAAILLDATGQVLHADAAALEMLAPDIAVAHGRLIGHDRRTDAWLRAVIASALGDKTPGEDLSGSHTHRGFHVRVARLANKGEEIPNRVCAVLLPFQATT